MTYTVSTVLPHRLIFGLEPRFDQRNSHPVKDKQPFIESNEGLFNLEVEAAGIEPAFNLDGTAVTNCNCVNCQEGRAARALHPGCPDWLQLSSLGADLQSVLLSWRRLPEPIRRAILALIESQKEGRTQR